MGKRKTRSSTVKAAAAAAAAAANTESSGPADKPRKTRKHSRAAATKSKPNTEDKAVTSEPEEGTSTQDSNSPEERSKAASPDPNCSICLGKLENKSFTDSCFHMFCFVCLLEWSKVKAVCPLCKQAFKSIIHNVRSFEDYDQYYLRAEEPAPFGEVDGNRFRYRTTLTADRWLDRLQRQHVNEVDLLRRPSQRTTRFQWRRLRENSTSEFRQRVYAAGLRVREVQSAAGRPMRYRDISPNFFRTNPAQTHRLVPWLNRELNALLHGLEDRVQNVLELIMDLIVRFDISSEEFYEHIQRYTGIHTAHFIHEFSSFARSPYDMVSYDRYALYYESDSIVQNIESGSGSSDDENSDIILLSESENDNEPLDLSGQAGRDHSYSSSGLTNNGSVLEHSTESDFLNADLTPLLTRVRNFLSSSIERGSGEADLTSVTTSSNASSTIPDLQLENISSVDLAVPASAPVFPSPSTFLNELSSAIMLEVSSNAPNPAGVDAAESDSSDIEIVGFDKPWEERSPVALSSEEDLPVVDVVDKKEKKEHKRTLLPARYRADRYEHRSSSSSSSYSLGQYSSDDHQTRRHHHPSSSRRRSPSRSTGRGSRSHRDKQHRSRHRSRSRSPTDRYRSGNRYERRSSRTREARYRRSRSRTNRRSRSRTDRSSKNRCRRNASRSRSRDKHRSDFRSGQRRRSRSGSRDHRFGSSRRSGYGHQNKTSHNSRSTYRSRRTRSRSVSRRRISRSSSRDRYSRKRRRKDSSSSIEVLYERRQRDRYHTSKKHKSHHKKSRHRHDRYDSGSDHSRYRHDSDSSVEVLRHRRRKSRSPAKKTTQSQAKNNDANKKAKRSCKKNPTGHKNRPIKLEKLDPPPVVNDTVASISGTTAGQSTTSGNINTENSGPTQTADNANNEVSNNTNNGNYRGNDTHNTSNAVVQSTDAIVAGQTLVSNSDNLINDIVETNMTKNNARNDTVGINIDSVRNVNINSNNIYEAAVNTNTYNKGRENRDRYNTVKEHINVNSRMTSNMSSRNQQNDNTKRRDNLESETSSEHTDSTDTDKECEPPVDKTDRATMARQTSSENNRHMSSVNNISENNVQVCPVFPQCNNLGVSTNCFASLPNLGLNQKGQYNAALSSESFFGNIVSENNKASNMDCVWLDLQQASSSIPSNRIADPTSSGPGEVSLLSPGYLNLWHTVFLKSSQNRNLAKPRILDSVVSDVISLDATVSDSPDIVVIDNDKVQNNATRDSIQAKALTDVSVNGSTRNSISQKFILDSLHSVAQQNVMYSPIIREMGDNANLSDLNVVWQNEERCGHPATNQLQTEKANITCHKHSWDLEISLDDSDISQDSSKSRTPDMSGDDVTVQETVVQAELYTCQDARDRNTKLTENCRSSPSTSDMREASSSSKQKERKRGPHRIVEIDLLSDEEVLNLTDQTTQKDKAHSISSGSDVIIDSSSDSSDEDFALRPARSKPSFANFRRVQKRSRNRFNFSRFTSNLSSSDFSDVTVESETESDSGTETANVMWYSRCPVRKDHGIVTIDGKKYKRLACKTIKTPVTVISSSDSEDCISKNTLQATEKRSYKKKLPSGKKRRRKVSKSSKHSKIIKPATIVNKKASDGSSRTRTRSRGQHVLKINSSTDSDEKEIEVDSSSGQVAVSDISPGRITSSPNESNIVPVKVSVDKTNDVCHISDDLSSSSCDSDSEEIVIDDSRPSGKYKSCSDISNLTVTSSSDAESSNEKNSFNGTPCNDPVAVQCTGQSRNNKCSQCGKMKADVLATHSHQIQSNTPLPEYTVLDSSIEKDEELGKMDVLKPLVKSTEEVEAVSTVFSDTKCQKSPEKSIRPPILSPNISSSKVKYPGEIDKELLEIDPGSEFKDREQTKNESENLHSQLCRPIQERTNTKLSNSDMSDTGVGTASDFDDCGPVASDTEIQNVVRYSKLDRQSESAIEDTHLQDANIEDSDSLGVRTTLVTVQSTGASGSECRFVEKSPTHSNLISEIAYSKRFVSRSDSDIVSHPFNQHRRISTNSSEPFVSKGDPIIDSANTSVLFNVTPLIPPAISRSTAVEGQNTDSHAVKDPLELNMIDSLQTIVEDSRIESREETQIDINSSILDKGGNKKSGDVDNKIAANLYPENCDPERTPQRTESVISENGAVCQHAITIKDKQSPCSDVEQCTAEASQSELTVYITNKHFNDTVKTSSARDSEQVNSNASLFDPDKETVEDRGNLIEKSCGKQGFDCELNPCVSNSTSTILGEEPCGQDVCESVTENGDNQFNTTAATSRELLQANVSESTTTIPCKEQHQEDGFESILDNDSDHDSASNILSDGEVQIPGSDSTSTIFAEDECEQDSQKSLGECDGDQRSNSCNLEVTNPVTETTLLTEESSAPKEVSNTVCHSGPGFAHDQDGDLVKSSVQSQNDNKSCDKSGNNLYITTDPVHQATASASPADGNVQYSLQVGENLSNISSCSVNTNSASASSEAKTEPSSLTQPASVALYKQNEAGNNTCDSFCNIENFVMTHPDVEDSTSHLHIEDCNQDRFTDQHYLNNRESNHL